MFVEPQAVIVNAVSNDLNRVAFGNRDGTFALQDGSLQLRITQNLGKRNRRTVRLDSTKTAADPLLDGVSRQYSMSAYLVIDHPLVGYSVTEAEQNAQALVDWLDVAGNLTKVIGGES